MLHLPHGHAGRFGNFPHGCRIKALLEKHPAGPFDNLLMFCFDGLGLFGRDVDQFLNVALPLPQKKFFFLKLPLCPLKIRANNQFLFVFSEFKSFPLTWISSLPRYESHQFPQSPAPQHRQAAASALVLRHGLFRRVTFPRR